ncbi:MAG: peptidase, partial [Chloroflexi bacterium]|nr:peptidase [Chloroflexota bacterium]
MGVQTKMWLLVVLMFGILYGLITGIGSYMGAGSASSYIILAILFVGLQYLIGPSLVSMMMRVKWVSEKEEPELHRMVAELA